MNTPIFENFNVYGAGLTDTSSGDFRDGNVVNMIRGTDPAATTSDTSYGVNFYNTITPMVLVFEH